MSRAVQFTNVRASEPSASVVPAARRPQPLVDRDQIDADAIFSPSFASDGTALFFQAESAGGSALKRAERGDSGVLHVATIVDDAAKNYHVKLSPDDRSVAFDSDRDGVRGVYVARADGSGVRRVSGNGYAAVPTWSPDGRRLAFLRAEDDRPAVWNLWLLDLDTGEMARLTNYRYGQVWAGAWFPDGRRIAYSHEDHLILLDLDSGRSTSYISPRRGRLCAHRGLARRPLDHVSGISRRRLAARSRVGIDAACARRSVRRRVHVGARWPARRVPQPAERQMELVDNGAALT